MIWARRLGAAAIVVAYVVSEPGRVLRSCLGGLRARRRDGG